VAAMLLGNGKNFKGKPLPLAEQNAQREIQRKAQLDIEAALKKLGLGLDERDKPDSSPASLYSRIPAPSAEVNP
jgi:hypothetical protein